MTTARNALAALFAASLTTGEVVAGPAVPVPEPARIVAAIAAVPIPRPKPDRPRKPIAPKVLTAKSWPKSFGRWPAAEVRQARARCISLLASRDVIWRPDEPIGEPGGCGTAAPIAVAEMSGVRINPPATVNCEFATALDEWIRNTLQSAARKAGGAAVSEIHNASSYACRRRNNARSGKLSEHGKANAIDIAGFTFADSRQSAVKGRSTNLLQRIGFARRDHFVEIARKSACKHFNTVLGPGSDAFHKDHLHLDLMKLRPGRFRMCR